MINWTEIYTSYLQGAKPTELAKEFNIDVKKISAKIKSEKWSLKKNKLKEKINGNFEKKLDKLTQKAFAQLEEILTDDTAPATSKIQAAKTIIDLAGLKKDKKEKENDTHFEIFINRESVKCR